MNAMKNARRTFGVAGLVVSMAAAVAWYRFAPGEAPPGQPPLVTIDAAGLEGLRADLTGTQTRRGLSFCCPDLRDLSAGGLRSRIASAAPRESGGSCVCRLATDAPDGLGRACQLCSSAGFPMTSAAVPGSTPSAGGADEERTRARPNRCRTAVFGQTFSGIWRPCIRRGRSGRIECRQPPCSTDRSVDVTDAIEDAITPGQRRRRTDSTTAPSTEPRTKGLVFLTRGGCVNTTVMRRNLDEALKALGLAAGYEMVDQRHPVVD